MTKRKFGVPEVKWDDVTDAEIKRSRERVRRRDVVEFRRLAQNSGTLWQRIKRWLNQPV